MSAPELLKWYDNTYPRSPAMQSKFFRAGQWGAWTVRGGDAYVELRVYRGMVEVRGLWVAPNRRRRGIGALAMRELLGECRRRELVVRLWVDPFDKGKTGPGYGVVHAFYVELGFQKSRADSGFLYWRPEYAR